MIQGLIKQAIAYDEGVEKIEKRFNNTYYSGGTLCIDVENTVLMINISNQEFYYASSGARRRMTDAEMYYACKLYIKHKNESNSFYQQALNFVFKHDNALPSNN